jgi:hypothetical protein
MSNHQLGRPFQSKHFLTMGVRRDAVKMGAFSIACSKQAPRAELDHRLKRRLLFSETILEKMFSATGKIAISSIETDALFLRYLGAASEDHRL